MEDERHLLPPAEVLEIGNTLDMPPPRGHIEMGKTAVSAMTWDDSFDDDAPGIATQEQLSNIIEFRLPMPESGYLAPVGEPATNKS